MDHRDVAERIVLEEEILSHVRCALMTAVDAPIRESTALHWLERVSFLGESFHRHLSRLFLIKEEGGYMDFVASSQLATLGHEVDRLKEDHATLPAELRGILADVAVADPGNLANLHSARQRLEGFSRQLDEHKYRERELWLDAHFIDIGGEG